MAAGKTGRAKSEPVKLRGGFTPTTKDIEAAIAPPRHSSRPFAMLLVDTNIDRAALPAECASEAVAQLFARDAVCRTEPLALIEFSDIWHISAVALHHRRHGA